jgi:outer membrane lipoprotein-sorting protein
MRLLTTHLARHLARLAAAFVLAAAAVPLSAQTFDLKSLMGWLAQTKEAQATFVEERTVNGFDSPLVASGELYFKAPLVFERRTLKPSRESMLVQGQSMTLARGSQRRTMSLDASPEAAAIVGALRGTLMGDIKTIEQHFKVGLTGKADQWLLDMVPRDEQLFASVRNVQVRGRQGVVNVIEIWLANGDRSVMRITPMALPKAAAASAPTQAVTN